MDLKTKVIGSALLCVAFNSAALTLGRMRGAAWVGQTLNLAIPVEFEADESQTSPCFEAEVFHADTKLAPNRVRVLLQAAPQSQTALVQVVTTVAVDEPVVTVYLHAGCTNKTSRRYVLLAELAEEVVTSVAAPVVPVPPVAAESSRPPGSAASATATPAVPRIAAPAEPVQRRPPAPKKPASPAAQPSGTAGPAAAAPAVSAKLADAAKRKKQPDELRIPAPAAGGARLRLDPIELLTERVAQLESASSTAPSADALSDAQRLQKFETDVKALLALAVKNERGMLELRERLQKAEAERYDNPLVYGLVLLLLACLVAVIYLWKQQGGGTPGGSDWWHGSTRVGDEAEAGRFERTHAATIQPDSSKSAAVEQVDLNLEALIPDVQTVPSKASEPELQAAGDALPAVMPSGEVGRGVAANWAGSSRAINSGALFDVRHQAEFFMSLGQTDQAIQVLQGRIRKGGGGSPLIYLDLLKIYHSLGMKEEYNRCREDFNRLFKGRVPDYAGFRDEGRNLDAYPQVLAPIALLWPSPDVLPVMESCIFRDASDGLDDYLDLAAFRDMVLLHAVAGSMVDEFLAGIVGARPAGQHVLEWEAPVPAAIGMPGQVGGRGAVADVSLSAQRPATLVQTGAAGVPTPAAGLELFQRPSLTVEREKEDTFPMIDFDLSGIGNRADVAAHQPAPGLSS